MWVDGRLATKTFPQIQIQIPNPLRSECLLTVGIRFGGPGASAASPRDAVARSAAIGGDGQAVRGRAQRLRPVAGGFHRRLGPTLQGARRQPSPSRQQAALDALLSARVDGVRDEFALEIEQVRGERPREQAGRVELPSSRMAGSGRGGASDSLGIDQEHRGKAHNTYVPPPNRGARYSNFRACSPPIGDAGYPNTADAFSFDVRADLPRFDGANSRLWQNRCEDQFKLWNTPPHRWISLAMSQFEGTAARWLELVQRKSPNISWSEFCCSLQSRFGRYQHQTLLRQLFHIAQTSTVADYVDRFTDLYDQLSAYEEIPNTLHYTTRFLDGLKPGVRIAVALHKPKDLDSAYDLALLHEELGEGVTHINSPAGVRSGPFPLPLPPKPRVSEDWPQSDTLKPTPAEDKWSVLRTYRKSKGLCFICGE